MEWTGSSDGRCQLPVSAAIQRFSRLYTFNETTQRMFVGNRYENAIKTSLHTPAAPSLLTMFDAFGENMVYDWMAANVTIVCGLAGNRDKLNGLQVASASTILIDKFTSLARVDLGDGRYRMQDNRLNSAEVLLFFHKMLSGNFGTFYGAIDIITIGKWADDFLLWRYNERVRLDDEQRARHQMEEAQKARVGIPMPKETKEVFDRVLESFSSWDKAAPASSPEISQETINEHNRQFLQQLNKDIQK